MKQGVEKELIAERTLKNNCLCPSFWIFIATLSKLGETDELYKNNSFCSMSTLLATLEI